MKSRELIQVLLFACLAGICHAQENSTYNILPGKDTLIIYNIKGISTEGAEAKVNYVNGKIAKSVTNIYGETGQSTIIYEFDTDKIKVSEKNTLIKQI